jgi:hypothetical protein
MHRVAGTAAFPGNFLDVREMDGAKNKTESSAVGASQDQPAFKRPLVWEELARLW